MGFFSWKTSDTQRSIPSSYSNRKKFPVHMITEDGQVFTENDYDGYGEFGGKDFYELLAELNGKVTREEGIDLSFNENPSGEFNGKFKLPKLVENLNTYVPRGDNEQWKNYFNLLPHSECCEFQGFFYDDGDDGDVCGVCGNDLDLGVCNTCED
jgi:hypothetical protein